MALSQSVASELLEAFRAGEGVDLIRESVRLVMQELIETEAAERIGAGHSVPEMNAELPITKSATQHRSQPIQSGRLARTQRLVDKQHPASNDGPARQRERRCDGDKNHLVADQ